MRVLVTGATGFVGSNLVRRLCKEGHEVIAIGKKGEQDISGLPAQFIEGNFCNIPVSSLGKIDALFHQAAITDTRVQDEDSMLFVNAAAPITFFRRLIEQGCSRIVYASSTAVYGNTTPPFVERRGERPLNPYGKSKLILDENAMSLGTPNVSLVGLRYCNVYGPGENHKGPMATMIHQLALQLNECKRPRLFHDGTQKRDYIYVDDVVEANLCALKNARRSCVVNCGSGIATSFNEIAERLQKMLGIEPPRAVEYFDMPPDIAKNYQSWTQCDMKRAEEMIKFTPKWPLERGLRDYHRSGALTRPIK